MGELSEGMIMATESAAILTPDDCEIGELLMKFAFFQFLR